jgi:hypothetical protein
LRDTHRWPLLQGRFRVPKAPQPQPQSPWFSLKNDW